jgi:hypothetical protein
MTTATTRAIIACAAISVAAALGASSPIGAKDADHDTSPAKWALGSWLLIVTPQVPAIPRFCVLETFSEGGGMTAVNNMDNRGQPSHGSWVRSGVQEIEGTHYGFSFGGPPAFTFLGTTKIGFTSRLEADGTLSGTFHTLARTPNGGLEIFGILTGTHIDAQQELVGGQLPEICAPFGN